uniref:Uncharacterized protein n=1 Tax=Anguilla anguilla TaxID=7936 RepID=A0A0E9S949_ANGAN
MSAMTPNVNNGGKVSSIFLIRVNLFFRLPLFAHHLRKMVSLCVFLVSG